MTHDTALLEQLDVAGPRRRWPQPGRALRALRRLIADPDATENAMEVGYALDGDYATREIAALVRTAAGRKLFAERPSLRARLIDRAGLAALPEDSLGRAYLKHMDTYGLEPQKLVELRQATDPEHAQRDEAQLWFLERDDLMHDLWHVLSGYGADGLGEAALLAFSSGQRRRLGRTFLTLGASIETTRMIGRRWIGYVWKAWRRGRRAAYLAALPYEELLPLPLAAVRAAIGIEPPEVAHPEGLITLP